MNVLRLLLLFLTLSLQNLYAQGEFIVEYDIPSSSYHKIGDKVDGVQYVLPGYNTYDENASIYYFYSGNFTNAIHGISTIDGSEVHVINNADLKAIEFSNTLNIMIALEDVDAKRLVHVDVSTGVIWPVSEPIPINSMVQGRDSYSEKDTLYTVGGLSTLYTIHAVTGEIVYVTQVSLSPDERIRHLEYHPITGVLYVVIDGGSEGYYLATIDLQTGELSKVGVVNDTYILNGSATIDVDNNLYIFISIDTGQYWITALSLDDGSIVYNRTMHVDQQDNLLDLEYDNKNKRLFSKHWDKLITNTNDDELLSIKLTPNPVTDRLTLEALPAEVDHAIIYGMDGTKIKSISLTHTDTLSLADLPNGQYICQLFAQRQSIHSLIFVVAR